MSRAGSSGASQPGARRGRGLNWAGEHGGAHDHLEHEDRGQGSAAHLVDGNGAPGLAAYPVGDAVYGPFSPSARLAVLVGQIVVPSLGGPLLGVALGRWVRFPGAAFVLFLVIFGWVELVTILTLSHQDSAPIAVLRLFSPFAFFTVHSDAGGVTAWRGSPWCFIGWQLALCAIAVLVALLRGAEGPVRSRIIRALAIAGATAVILLVLAGTGGFTHAVTA